MPISKAEKKLVAQVHKWLAANLMNNDIPSETWNALSTIARLITFRKFDDLRKIANDYVD